MLDGYIKILYYLGVRRYLVYELVVKLVGIGVVQPYPLNAVYLAYPAAELGKAALTVKIGAVARYILRDDDDLLNAVSRQITRLLDDVLKLP